MTKIYCDTADIKLIKKCIKKFNADGVTTNPSIMRATGVKDYKSQCLKILKITKKKPLSVEVFADNPNEIYKQAQKIKNWNKNLYVKIPIVNTKGFILNNVIKKLNHERIRINININSKIKSQSNHYCHTHTHAHSHHLSDYHQNFHQIHLMIGSCL